MVEIKNFNFLENPAFDCADFYSFVESLDKEIEKLYADYLVFGYLLDEKGNLSIPQIWKLKIWEITGKSCSNHVTVQIRGKKCEKGSKLADDNIDTKGRIQKFRPYNFKDEGSKNKFSGPLEFLTACQKLLLHNHNTMHDYRDWLHKVKLAHREKFAAEIK